MMKQKTLFTVAFAALSLFSLSLVGCGGGNGDIQEDETITRTLLGGTGNSTTLTTKKWRTVFLRVNSNYVGTGADQACPVEVTSVNGLDFTSCDPTESLELRSDGKARAIRSGVPAGEEDGFDSEWALNGDTLVLVNRTESEGRITGTYRLTNEGIAGSKQRIRMNTLSETEADGTTLRPGEVGFQFVIEEV